MKKLLFVLVIAMLLCLTALADEAAPLTVDELMGFCDAAVEDVLARAPVAGQEAEDGGYVFDYGDLRIYTLDSSFTAESRVTGVELLGENEDLDAPRGVALGSTLYELLPAYPLDNENLAGDYDGAVLYISGLLPGTVNVGYAVRDGARVSLVVYETYTPDGERAEVCGVQYSLEDNTVTSVRVLLNARELSLDDAQEELDALAALQEKDEYRVYRSDDPAPLAREDLTFGPIDFISATADSMTAVLGIAESDTWENDSEGFLRILQWEGVQAIFHYDAQRSDEQLALLDIYGEKLEGPRNLHMDDDIESVLERFPQENPIGVLYGDGENAPYGLLELNDGGASIVYAVEVEEGSVLLSLTFVGDRLADMTCSVL